MQPKTLPDCVTSYDLLKTFAIITMIIDHVGAYMVPDILELRAIGRLSAPVWFFLIGYALNRKLEMRLWIWGVLLAAGVFAIDQTTLPINILFTFLLIRATLNPLMSLVETSFMKLALTFLAMFILTFVTFTYFEYGAAGYLCAMIGYLARHKDRLKINSDQLIILSVIAFVLYAIFQCLLFQFTQIQSLLVLGAFLVMASLLVYFRSETYPEMLKNNPILKQLIFLTGRRTLEIYVIHILIFKAFGIYVLGVADL